MKTNKLKHLYVEELKDLQAFNQDIIESMRGGLMTADLDGTILVMNRAGDRNKPILITEFAWPASRGKTQLQYSFDTDETGQATRLARMLPMLAGERFKLGLAGFYYYTWISNYDPANNYPFDYTGLLKFGAGQASSTPAYSVFRRDALAMEGCRSKASVATRCAR